MVLLLARIMCPFEGNQKKENRQLFTKHDGRDHGETDALDNDMKPPVRDVLAQLAEGKRQAANKEDERHGAVDDAVFTPDHASVGSDICQEHTHKIVSRRLLSTQPPMNTWLLRYDTTFFLFSFLARNGVSKFSSATLRNLARNPALSCSVSGSGEESAIVGGMASSPDKGLHIKEKKLQNYEAITHASEESLLLNEPSGQRLLRGGVTSLTGRSPASVDMLVGQSSERPAYYLGLADVVICTIGEVAD
ncbi:unnamed protein product [Clonostachys solani]|uniref:Uncharacterized protein n=1 Tax=Clonostachys solani TaxID=160281 RepID=A0A9P0EHQ7_9HYPO|nr:unnamed protein product [Clonostachys solani]